ncbi:hypothetical protein QFZ40_003869 [Arthrobacter pascens]|nr:hypothetical protein [Arthrobacter pascens]
MTKPDAVRIGISGSYATASLLLSAFGTPRS